MVGILRSDALEVVGPGTYFIGIIDILQEWSWAKSLERMAKVAFKLQDKNGVSAVPPELYMRRFKERVVQEVISEGSLRREEYVNSLMASRNESAANETPPPPPPPPRDVLAARLRDLAQSLAAVREKREKLELEEQRLRQALSEVDLDEVSMSQSLEL
jgi:hypothetical protein